MSIAKVTAAVAAACAVVAALPAPAEAGRTIDYIAETCFACHRSGASDGIPAITGRPGGEIAVALAAFRSGERKNPIMNAIAAELEPTQIGMLSAFLAKQR